MAVKFHQILVNAVQLRECVWQGDDGSFVARDFDEMPESYKLMYVLSLRMEGVEVPEALQQYVTDNLKVTLEWDL